MRTSVETIFIKNFLRFTFTLKVKFTGILRLCFTLWFQISVITDLMSSFNSIKDLKSIHYTSSSNNVNLCINFVLVILGTIVKLKIQSWSAIISYSLMNSNCCWIQAAFLSLYKMYNVILYIWVNLNYVMWPHGTLKGTSSWSTEVFFVDNCLDIHRFHCTKSYFGPEVTY